MNRRHTECTLCCMLNTLVEGLELNRSLSSVTPYYFACLSETFLIICESDEVFEGGNCAFPWNFKV